MNLIYCYKNLGDFQKIYELLQIIHHLIEHNQSEDIRKRFKKILDEIQLFQKLGLILQSIGEIRLLTTDLVTKDLFLH